MGGLDAVRAKVYSTFLPDFKLLPRPYWMIISSLKLHPSGIPPEQVSICTFTTHGKAVERGDYS